MSTKRSELIDGDIDAYLTEVDGQYRVRVRIQLGTTTLLLDSPKFNNSGQATTLVSAVNKHKLCKAEDLEQIADTLDSAYLDLIDNEDYETARKANSAALELRKKLT